MPPFNRKEGETVTYTPAQTRRYFSFARRYQRALAIKPAFQQQSGDSTIYYFKSLRSPIGYWRVTQTPAGLDEGEGDGDNPPLILDEPYGQRVEYITRTVRTREYGSRYNPETGEYEDFDSGTSTVVRNRISPQGPGIISPPAPPPSVDVLPFDSLNDEDPAYDSIFALTIAGDGSVVTNYYLRSNGRTYDIGGTTNGGGYSTGSGGTTGYSYTTQSIHLLVHFENGDILGTGTGGNPPTVTIVNGFPYTFDCDCPDMTRRVGALPWAKYPSEAKLRDWTGSNAGISDQPSPYNQCKHIISTKLGLGVPLQELVITIDAGVDEPPELDYDKLSLEIAADQAYQDFKEDFQQFLNELLNDKLNWLAQTHTNDYAPPNTFEAKYEKLVYLYWHAYELDVAADSVASVPSVTSAFMSGNYQVPTLVGSLGGEPIIDVNQLLTDIMQGSAFTSPLPSIPAQPVPVQPWEPDYYAADFLRHHK